MPRCPSCGLTKPNEDFPRNRATKSGLATYCKPCHNRIMKANRERHHGTTRQFHLKRRYGVDQCQIHWMVLRQNGVCAVCREGVPEHVDHCHKTNRVRGVLCFNCNRGLGKLGDDPRLLLRAIDYLETH